MNMMKILGMMAVGILVGVPSFVVANVCVYGDVDYNTSSCYATGGTPGASASQINVRTAPSVQTEPSVRPSSGLSANTQLQNPIKYSTFSEFAAAVTKTAVQVLMPFIVLAFIYSGFLFVSAQGNETKLTNAKNILLYSMLGAFILLGAWGFAQIIGQTVSTLTQ
ncbi:MAG: hypothetical protein UW25_C0004G0079 [Candidatus Nomurabacteria bacterium GW2011_GWB1_44_12]|uniref:Uncharacterized protein n=1 Tax=Candidatus Nomurabacteria bacterium GW2011_GWB1_44_12 TaxID=1618748 RepID=A0A837ICZ2_9BACT|nr:MAG: hypothetical protein UW25_C0004G0079 [Candidatus Nomurabacteria bacterium GW2011_GWB1_44_12]